MTGFLGSHSWRGCALLATASKLTLLTLTDIEVIFIVRPTERALRKRRASPAPGVEAVILVHTIGALARHMPASLCRSDCLGTLFVAAVEVVVGERVFLVGLLLAHEGQSPAAVGQKNVLRLFNILSNTLHFCKSVAYF